MLKLVHRHPAGGVACLIYFAMAGVIRLPECLRLGAYTEMGAHVDMVLRKCSVLVKYAAIASGRGSQIVVRRMDDKRIGALGVFI
jgi:hypothetical protein